MLKTTTVGCHVPHCPRHYVNKPNDSFIMKYNTRTQSDGVDDLITRLIGEGNLAGHASFIRIEKLYQVARCIKIQEAIGLDIISEGELGRDIYYSYFKEFLEKNESGQLHLTKNQTTEDFKTAKIFTDKPIKMTIPGPCTLASVFLSSGIANESFESLSTALAECVREEITTLYEEGCRHIQIDEPIFTTYPIHAKSFGIDLLTHCFGDRPQLRKYLHICRNYQSNIDGPPRRGQEQRLYEPLADKLNSSCVDVLSIEDAALQNSSEVFAATKDKFLMLGVCNVGITKVECASDIAERVSEIAQIRGNSNIILSPDCGFLFLDYQSAIKKMQAIVESRDLLQDLL